MNNRINNLILQLLLLLNFSCVTGKALKRC